MMKMFKSYSPLPASPLAVLGMRWKGGGLRGGGAHSTTGGSQRGQREQQHSGSLKQTLSTAPLLIEKVCFHLSQMSECERGEGKETTALSRGDEEGDSSPARSWSAGWVWGKDQEEVRERQGSSTDKCNQGWPPSWCWEGKQSTTWIPPPTVCKQQSAFFSPAPSPHVLNL